MVTILKIDHIGYAVKNIDKAINAFKIIGYEFENIIDDIDRNIKICFGSKDGYTIELVQSKERNKTSPVDTYLKSIGPTAYHICYTSDDFLEDVESLQKEGFKVIIEPAKAIAFGNKRVVFMMNLRIGLIEIVEK